MANQLQSKSEQAKLASVDQTATQSIPQVTVTATMDTSIPTSEKTIIDKIKNYAMKSVTPGSKILYWHVALGAVVVFVLYVEMFADRKTQRKLKFW